MLPKKVVLLDLETTGLSPTKHQIISIGLTYMTVENTLKTEHWFLDEPNEEAHLLKRLLTFLEDYEAVFTYYGRGFEFPFIKARLNHYGLDATAFFKLKLIDMKVPLKAFAQKRSQLEALFGFKRHSESDGYDVVKLYRTYEKTKAPIYKTCLLAHQQEELLSLALFFELYMTLYQNEQWTLKNQQMDGDYLILFLQSPSNFTAHFEGTFEGLRLAYQEGKNELLLTLPLLNGTLAHDLEPLKDYYYMETQKELIHKSLAQFIPKNLLRKATRNECVVYKESTFVPLLSTYKMTCPLWHAEDARPYIELKDVTLTLVQTQLFTFFFSRQKR